MGIGHDRPVESPSFRAMIVTYHRYEKHETEPTGGFNPHSPDHIDKRSTAVEPHTPLGGRFPQSDPALNHLASRRQECGEMNLTEAERLVP